MRRMSGQRLAGILEWTPIFKRAHKRYKQAGGEEAEESDHPPAREMEFEPWPSCGGERPSYVSVVGRRDADADVDASRLWPRFDRYLLAASTKFANWKRRLIRWMSIRDFRFYGLIGVYELLRAACTRKREVWILWIEGLVVVRGREFLFFFFFYGEKFVCFEFDRPLGIVEILRVILGVSSFDLFLVNLDNLYEWLKITRRNK